MHIIKQQWNRNSVGNNGNYTVTHADNNGVQNVLIDETVKSKPVFSL